MNTGRGAGTVDVAVLGGGPAGATAARLLASWGHDVVLLTRPGLRPAMAESLPPSCLRLLDRLGVRAAIDAAGFVRSSGNTVHWGGAAPRVEAFGSGVVGYQVMRDVFDGVLFDEAARAGVTIRQPATVREVATDATGESRIVFDDEGGHHQLRARWVLDATGRVGVVARRGWRRPMLGERTVALAAMWECTTGRGDAAPTHTVVESYDDGWGWSVPCSPTLRLVTVMVEPGRTHVERRARLDDTYARELHRLPALSALAGGAARQGAVFARDASPYTAQPFAAPGVMLVGDAASFVDPLSSFGVKKALASAWLAAVVARTVLSDAAMIPPALALYEEREREIHDALERHRAALIGDATAGHPHGYWGDRSSSFSAAIDREPDHLALREDPEVLRAFTELRTRDGIVLAPSPTLRRELRPAVRDDRVVMEEHLLLRDFPQGIRHLRNVDLLRLYELAPAHRQVPDLLDAYARAQPGAAIADLLGALSVLIGKGALILD